MNASPPQTADSISMDGIWTRSGRIGWALSEGIPLGPFEGLELSVLQTSNRSGKLHGSASCSRLRRAVTRPNTIELTADVLPRLCASCEWTQPAAHPIWDLFELACSMLVALSFGDAEDDDLAGRVESAAAVLGERHSDDDDDDRYRVWTEASDLREFVRGQWRRLSTYALRAHQLVDSAPWTAGWAAKPLADLENRTETYRSFLAILIDPRAAVEGARIIDAEFPGPTDSDHFTAAGVDADAAIKRMWDRWCDAVADSWTRASDESWHAVHALNEMLGRRRNGRHEAIAAAEGIAAGWCQQAQSSDGDEQVIDIDVRVPLWEPRPSWQVRESDRVDRWSVATIVTYQQSVDWSRGVTRLRCPVAVAGLLAQNLDYRSRREEPVSQGAVVGPEHPRPILWGPARAERSTSADAMHIELWPSPDSSSLPEQSVLYGRKLLARYANPRLARALATIGEDTDLRSVKWPDWMTLHDQSHAYDVLLTGWNTIDLRPFLEGKPLGPLADVQVYATDARGRYQGKSHGVGCTHMKEGMRPDDEMYPLVEFLEILRDSERVDRWVSRWCSKCGGYSIRRASFKTKVTDI